MVTFFAIYKGLFEKCILIMTVLRILKNVKYDLYQKYLFDQPQGHIKPFVASSWLAQKRFLL